MTLALPVVDRLTYMDQLLVLHAVALILLVLGFIAALIALVHLCNLGAGPYEEEE